MKKWLKMLGAFAAIVIILGGIWGFKVKRQIDAYKASANPPQTVSAIAVSNESWRQQLEAVGTLRAIQGADISAEVAGTVYEIHAESGQNITTGAPMISLLANDDRARLQALQATAELAELTLNRGRLQIKTNSISQAQLDTDEASLKNAKAQVAAQQATLSKKIIHAPFAGVVGILAVDVGQYVAPGSKLVSLQSVDPIYVDFHVPQRSLGALKAGQTVVASNDAYPALTFTGVVTAIDSRVDTDTRNIQVRAKLANPEHKLLPGMFITLSVDIGEPQHYLTIPQSALTYNPYGSTVFVITPAPADTTKKDDQQPAASALVAKQVFVTSGLTRGDQVAIIKGLKEGDRVVTSGQIKLKNDTPVVVDNTVVPSNDPDPKPVDE